MNLGEDGLVRTLRRLLDGTVLVFGAWTLHCYILGLFGASYRFLFVTAWAPLALAAWAQLRLPCRDDRPGDEAEQLPVSRRQLLLGSSAAVGAILLFNLTGRYTLFWFSAVAVLLLVLRIPIRQASEEAFRAPPERVGVVVLLCVLAVAVTLSAHRPDADDSFYMSLVTGSLDHPAQPILRYDTMYGETNLPLIESAYRLRSYELFVAMLSLATPLPPKAIYYLILPSLFAVLVVAVNWLTLREIGGSFAWVGAAVAVLVLLAWGDGNATFGNFAFVRLFQGKAVMVAVFVPAAIFYASRFARGRSTRNWLLLAAVQTAALGMSPSAVVAVPLASAVFLIAAAPDSRGSKLIVEGLLASTVVVVAGAAVFAMMPIEGQLPESARAFWRLVDGANVGLTAVLGRPGRQAVALLALLLVPILAPPGRRGRVLRRYVLISVLVMMNPLLPGMLGVITARLTWRVFWSVPFPLLLGLVAQRLVASGLPGRKASWVGATALATGFALMPGLWTVSPENNTRFGPPRYKVGPGHAVARSIVEQTTPEDLVLAPHTVAQWVPTFSRHPRLVGIRPNYYNVLAEIDWQGMHERIMLVRLVTRSRFPDPDLHTAAEAIQRRRVSLVVMSSRLPRRDDLAAAFETIGCRPANLTQPEGIGPFEAWRCAGR